MKGEALFDRFWGKVVISDNGCWVWNGTRTSQGYGVIRRGGKRNSRELHAHRVAYEKINGPIVPKMYVLHSCLNSACVRPHHLFLGDAFMAQARLHVRPNEDLATLRLMSNSLRSYYRNKEKRLLQQHRHRQLIGRKGEREYYNRERALTIQALGSRCQRCGFSDVRALQIDHKNGGGSQERKRLRSMITYLRLVRACPSNYQILCANCNWIKKCENGEI